MIHPKRKKRILLISTAKNYRKGHKGKATPCAALGIIAAYTPPHYDVTIINEQNGDKVFREGADLVAFSAMTSQINRSIEVSQYYRAKGVPTVIGGIHASVRPEDARGHFDATVLGEGDLVWPELLKDFENGSLKEEYKADRLIDMADVAPFRHDLLYKKKTTVSHAIVQVSRGCPYKCDFCSAVGLFGDHYRTRPVENVIREIKGLKQKFTFFVDDNIMGDANYARELFTRMLPLKKYWAGQASLGLSTRDAGLLCLAKKSGCRGLFVGIESISNPGKLGKLSSGNLKKISEKIRMIQDEGILVHTSVVYGFDHDDQYCFEKTIDFLLKNKVGLTSICTLTPYPGSALFTRLEKEGRILHRDWEKYNNFYPVFKLAKMDPEVLKAGARWSSYYFYRAKNVLKRLPRNLSNLLYYSILNFHYNRSTRKNLHDGARITPMPAEMKQEWLEQM